MNAQLYTPPDIRKQRIEEIEAHIQAKRSRRMTLLVTFQEKEQERFTKVQTKEQERFNKRLDATKNALQKAAEAIQRVENQLSQLQQINHNLVNVEGELFALDSGEDDTSAS